jgi:hypothetical protein
LTHSGNQACYVLLRVRQLVGVNECSTSSNPNALKGEDLGSIPFLTWVVEGKIVLQHGTGYALI